MVFGFGYDSVSDDYKVVRLFQFFANDDIGFVSETNVYSPRLNSWRIIDNVPDWLIGTTQEAGAFICGALHWVATKLAESEFHVRLVVAFDVVREEYTTISLPDFSRDEVAGLFVSELGGCLSIVRQHVEVGGVDVWVMKEYRVKDSWTKLLTLSSLIILRPVECVIPLAYSERGDELVLMLNSKELLYYNLEKRTIKFVDMRCRHAYFFPPMICLESLVSLGEKAENDEKERQEKQFLSVGFKLML